jgi:hypothetical protein
VNAVVIQGSPKRNQGNTYSILSPFIDGMIEAGANIDLVFAKDYSIKPCEGCFYCMFKSGGNCCIKDDMQQLIQKLKQADIWVIAGPVYFGGFTSSIRKILERLSPLLDPSFQNYNGITGHPWRENIMVKKIALVASCASLELINFDSLIAELQCICKKCGKNDSLITKYAGALLFRNAQDFNSNPEMKDICKTLQRTAKEAGKELIMNDQITSTFQDIIKEKIDQLSIDEVIQKKNVYVRNILEKTIQSI